MAAIAAPKTEVPFYIPSVDISPYFEDPSSPAAKKVIEDIRTACLSTGFFQLLGHGVPKQLQKDVFNGAEKFFKLPTDVKMPLSAKKNSGFKGYDVLASQSYEDDKKPDLKEGYVSGFDLPADDERVLKKRFFAAPNIWPSPEHIAPGDFKEPVEKYYDAMSDLSGVVLDLVAATLPYGPNVFKGFRDNEPACPLRVLHYPPTPKENLATQLGSSAHTDFGAITLLLQDEHEGLEVLDQKSGEWKLVPPNPDAYVVNLGDMLSMMTGGVYKSSVHRVINKNKTDRYSVVFFFDGNLDYKLKPLDANGPGQNEDSMTAEEYMYKRLNFTYGRHAKKEEPATNSAAAPAAQAVAASA